MTEFVPKKNMKVGKSLSAQFFLKLAMGLEIIFNVISHFGACGVRSTLVCFYMEEGKMRRFAAVTDDRYPIGCDQLQQNLY